MKKYKRYALIGAAGGVGAVLIGDLGTKFYLFLIFLGLTGGIAAPLVAGSVGAITGVSGKPFLIDI